MNTATKTTNAILLGLLLAGVCAAAESVQFKKIVLDRTW